MVAPASAKSIAASFLKPCADPGTPAARQKQGGRQLQLASRENPRCSDKHADHQNAERDVVETVRENVHGLVPITLKVSLLLASSM